MSKVTTCSIYTYSTPNQYEYRIKHGDIPWVKVGDTTRDVELRVSEQDGTSDAEPLEIKQKWHNIPFRDHTLHAHLKKKGFLRLRDNREWFKCTEIDIAIAINELINGVARPNAYLMRDEQQECHDKAVDFFNAGHNNFLVNAKMRFGKTFTGYKIAQSIKAKRILIMTYKPSVELSWKEDLNYHVDFDGWDFKSARTDFDSKNPIVLDGNSEVEVLFTSFQDFNDFEKAKWSIAKSYHYDLIIIDEMHYGTNTKKAIESLEQLSYDKILYLSGTPIRALMSGKYLPDQIYTWSYSDEQRRRNIEMAGGWKTEIYRWLPKMHTYMYEVCDDAKKLMNVYNEEEAFSMTKMWGTDSNGNFNDPAAVDLFLGQLAGSGVRKTQSPYRTVPGLYHTLWTLPSSVKSVNALEEALNKHPFFSSYKILNVAGDNIRSIEKVLNEITLSEHNGQSTITITCGRFNTGVTVKPWNAVFMLDDGKSPETYYQTIFRCQSPYQEKLKEDCYVFDFNPQRLLSVVYEYSDVVANDQEKSAAETLREYLEFAPIMDHTGNTPVEVDTNSILDIISETGGYIEQFANASMFCISAIDDRIIEMLGDVDEITAVKITKTLSDNGMGGGKNYRGKGNNKKIEDKRIKDAIESIRKKAQMVSRRLPNYLYAIDDDENSYYDIAKANNTGIFKEVTGVEVDDFVYMVENKFIIVERLNRCIMAFNQTLVI